MNVGSLSFEKYGKLIDDEERLKIAFNAIFDRPDSAKNGHH
jgi:hypothetical protein